MLLEFLKGETIQAAAEQDVVRIDWFDIDALGE